MFVKCSQNGQLELYQNQCTFQKIHSLSTGGAHSQVLAYIASPTSPPYVGKQLTALFHTQPLLKYLVYSIAAPTVNCIFNKAQPSTPSTWPPSPTRLGIRPRDLGLYPRNTLSATWAFLLLLDTNLLHKQALLTTHSYMKRQHSTKLLLCKKIINKKMLI